MLLPKQGGGNLKIGTIDIPYCDLNQVNSLPFDFIMIVSGTQYTINDYTISLNELWRIGIGQNKVLWDVSICSPGFGENSNIGQNNELNRDKWVIEKLSKLNEGITLLDAGAGEQKYKKYCKHLQYISQDFNEYDGTGDGKALQTGEWNTENINIVSDIIDIPRDDESFDAILCTEVFEHIPSPELAVKEFSRLLKSSGILILTAPFCSLSHFAPYHYSTGFNKYWYEVILNKYHFEILEMKTNGNYFEYIAQEIRRLNFIAAQYNRKNTKYLDRETTQTLLSVLNNMSVATEGSDELLCFGYQVLARKKDSIKTF